MCYIYFPEWENKLLRTFPNMSEGIRLENESRLEGQKVKYQNFISSALSKAGVELSENEELQFEVWGYDMTVTGTVPNDKLELINEKLADNTNLLLKNRQNPVSSGNAFNGFICQIYDRITQPVNDIIKRIKGFIFKTFCTNFFPDLFYRIHFRSVRGNKNNVNIFGDLKRT